MVGAGVGWGEVGGEGGVGGGGRIGGRGLGGGDGEGGGHVGVILFFCESSLLRTNHVTRRRGCESSLFGRLLPEVREFIKVHLYCLLQNNEYTLYVCSYGRKHRTQETLADTL